MKECVSHHFACDCREAKFREAFKYILNEATLNPDDSLVDITNEAIECVGLQAEWKEDDDKLIIITPRFSQ